MRHIHIVICLSCLCSATALADRVHLTNGTVIDGKATRQGDKVVIAMDSGELSLPADSVKSIESSESNIDIYDKRYAQLNARDVNARLALADFCRDHDMRVREQALLREVLDIDSSHEQARLRLGYVKTEVGWVTEAEAMRARGMTWLDGRWVSPTEALEIERLRAQTETAKHERDKAQAELDTQRVQLDSAKQNAAKEQATPVPVPAPRPVYYYGMSYRDMREAECGPRSHCSRRPRKTNPYPFPIPGVRDPRDPSYLVPAGVRDPRTSF